MSGFDRKTIVAAFIWKGLERGSSQFLSLAIQVVLARIIAPEHFGELAILVSIVNFVLIFVDSGIATALIRKKELTETDISSVFYLIMSFAMLLYVILFFVSPVIAKIYNAPVLKAALRVLSTMIFFRAFNSIQVALLSREMNFKAIFYRSIVAIPVSGCIAIAMAYCGYGVWALVAYNLTNIITTCIVTCFSITVKISRDFSWESIKEIYSFSIKIMFTGVFAGFNDIMRTMAIGKIYTKEMLAYYDKGYTYSSYAGDLITSTMSAVMLPTFAQEQNDKVRLKNMLRRSVKISAYTITPFLCMFSAMADPLVNFLLTDKWMQCVFYLQIFCIFRIPVCLNVLDKQAYYAIGKSEIVLIWEIVMGVTNFISLILCLTLPQLNTSPKYIAIGAIIFGFIGNFVIMCISKVVFDYSLHERFSDLLKPIVNGIIIFIALILIGKIKINMVILLAAQSLVAIGIHIIVAVVLKDDNLYYIKNLLANKSK